MFKKILLMLLMVAPLSLLAQKVAHYNSQEIVTNYSEFKKVQTEVEAIGKQYQADLEAMQKELQSKFEKYLAEVNDKTPANIRARKEKELQDLQQRIQQTAQDNEQAFRQEQQKRLQPVLDKVNAAISSVVKAGQYVFAIDKSAAQGMIHINEALSTDITAQIKSQLGIK